MHGALLLMKMSALNRMIAKTSASASRPCFQALSFILSMNSTMKSRSLVQWQCNSIINMRLSSLSLTSNMSVRKFSSSSNSSHNNINSNSNSSNSGDRDKKKNSSSSRKLGSSSSKQNSNTSGGNFWSRDKHNRDKDKPSSASSKLFACTDAPEYSASAEHQYKDDPLQSQRWKSTAVFQNYGRVYDADKEALSDAQTKAFPAVKCLSLTSKDVIYPDNIDADIKLVGLSFKQYGQDACKSWLYPFSQNFKSEYDTVKVGELLINEFQILSGLQFMFVSGAKSTVPEDRWSNSAVKVGGVMVSC